MDLTPRLLTEVEFREQWRGYSPNDVDDFLERVAAAVGALQEQLKEMTERATQAERRLLERSDDDEIRRTLVLAQRTAAQAVEEARLEAERILDDADRRARAQVAEAEARLADVEAEIAERARVELGELAERRAALQADVDALVAFQEEHRARLRAELQRQLAELDAPAASATALAVPDPPELTDVDLTVPEPSLDIEIEPPPTPAPTAAADAPRPPTEEEVAQAREDLLEALRRAGVEEFTSLTSGPAPEEPPTADPAPAGDATAAWAPAWVAPPTTAEPEGEGEGEGGPAGEVEASPVEAAAPPQPQLYDAADESGEIDLPVAPMGEAPELDAVQWRDEPVEPSEETEPAPSSADEDDPFLAELRRAVTDTEPLGPRDDDDLPGGFGDRDDAVPSGRFRLRRGR